MKSLLKQLLFITLALPFFLAPFYFYKSSEASQRSYIDSFVIHNEPNFNDHMTLSKYGHLMLSTEKPNLVIIGASGVQHGFRPGVMQKDFPQFQVSNLAMSGINISGIFEMLRAAVNTLGPEKSQQATFVVGAFFATFNENAVRFSGNNGIPEGRKNLLSSGMFEEREPNEFYPKYSLEEWQIKTSLMQDPFKNFTPSPFPDLYWSFDTIKKVISKSYQKLGFQTGEKVGINNFREKGYSDFNDYLALDFWPNFMQRPNGDISAEQFEVLLELARYAEMKKLKVYFVDLPIPDWHEKKSKLFANYQQMKKTYFPKVFTGPAFKYIQFQDLNKPEYFVDSVHIGQDFTWLWSQELKKRMDLSSMEGRYEAYSR